MTWCNLYSTESKYNITVNKSRYKWGVYGAGILISITLALLKYTFAYQWVVFFLAFSLLFFGYFLFKEKSAYHSAMYDFSMNTQGQCLFTLSDSSVVKSYQLLAKSRISFVGCWLFMKPIGLNHRNSNRTKRIFLFKDSISNQDYSRISRILKSL